MQTTFLNAAGTVLFTRDDMEQGNWTQEEYTVNATFPFVAGKVIERGQRLSFRDPATDSIEVFEIRNVNNIETEHYQQIIAEHIAVSELSDEHINNKEITDKTPKQALDTVLAGTLWAAGNMGVSRTSSVDIGRGSVWQAVGAIAQNWNVYITPRVTINAAGAITGRYLDVTESTGVWRGLRLSIDKNMSDASVVYDDSETYTALYGYGGNVDTAQQSGDDTRQELTFASVVWTATEEHPAKPAGQTYLEDPQATALYGRNGRPRFGYYQNSSIEDPAILLQKTWESLKLSSKPKVNISGTVSDLYRLGYKDQPIRLHDLAIVDIPETGESFYLQIIKNDVDLIDPTATRPEIGDYIANIIYINRATESYATTGKASGGGGGGGGRGGGNETNLYNTYSAFEKSTDEYGSMIGMVVGKRNGNNYIKAGEIALSINSTSGESTALINASHVNISATNDVYTLAGDLEHTADGKLVIKNAGGMYVQRTESGITSQFGVWDNGNLTGGIMVEKINGQTTTYINGDHINISATNDIYTLAGDIAHDANGRLIIKNAAGMYVEKTESGRTSYYGVFDDSNLTAGVIATKINGVPSTYIQGENIYIGDEKSTTVIAGKCTLSDVTADVIKTRLATASGVSCIDFSATSGGFTTLSASSSLTVAQQTHNVYNASVSDDGKTLYIYRHTGGPITFNKTAVDETSKIMLGSKVLVTPCVGSELSGRMQGNPVKINLYDADGELYNDRNNPTCYLRGSYIQNYYEAGEAYNCYPVNSGGTAYYKLA